MRVHKRPSRHRAWLGVLILTIFCQGCSALPQLVRHRDPLSAEEHVRLGASYEAQGLQEEAVDQYKTALQLQKNSIPALMAWGNLAFAKRDWKNAQACYRRILRLDPTHAGANNNLAMVYVSMGTHLDIAEHCAQTALTQGGPLKPYVLDTLATIFIKENRSTEARKALDDALAAAPEGNKPLRDQLSKTRESLAMIRSGH